MLCIEVSTYSLAIFAMVSIVQDPNKLLQSSVQSRTRQQLCAVQFSAVCTVFSLIQKIIPVFCWSRITVRISVSLQGWPEPYNKPETSECNVQLIYFTHPCYGKIKYITQQTLDYNVNCNGPFISCRLWFNRLPLFL